LPRIICGSSAGAIVAAIICTRPYEELEELFDPHVYKFDFYKFKEKYLTLKIARFFKDGVIFDMEHLQGYLKTLYGELTFIEAYKKFGWNLNVSVSILNEKEGS
jgi:TAG lipase / steryl ester hydrolase / phospholipase A2 / LPA acyltransferase